ncbi:glycine/betaine ABC transporter permease [Lottiidibacillus patelloidae]|uniref:Glycine/betaine ABC transporter permease n=1 Tax=Lottiidibacillus patelloidae TaxID=2670334 RepID=A0A263BXY2_9BACI|nr:BCCT family transporter [Lottiidibacillus patelloidae]OZM58432.1 glycine/betaine ABC transporter permease [Lottiidibacillus patelloidae]
MKKFTNVFLISVSLAIIFIAWGAMEKSKLWDIFPGWELSNVTNVIQTFIIDKFGWFYLLAATSFLIFALTLIFTRFGNIRLGKDADRPDYSYLSWFAMLFSAGMGIGLVFWGVAEPMYHYYGPPVGEGQTVESAKVAIRYSFFHWGLHPWAIYTLIGLALAYFKFRKGASGVISSIFRPIFGDKINGPLGTTIDVIAVFATIFGVATSLGFGASQISGGLSYLFPIIVNDETTQLVVILIVTVLFMLSAQTGLNKGIKYLSNINIILAISLMLFLLFAGPTNFIMNMFTTSIGSYLQNLPSMSFKLNPFEQLSLGEGESTFAQGWTIFYWAWWIAWAPFVGTFIARISKGRTVREFVIGVLAVPTLFGGLWFSVFGGSAIYLDQIKNAGIKAVMDAQGKEVALFSVLEQFPLGFFMSLLAILLISTFFITSADSATFVLGMQTTNGSLHPSNFIKFIWGIIQSSAAAVLLWFGGLGALQTASIIAAFPFTIIMILMMFSLLKSFRTEKIPTRIKPNNEE